MEVALEAMSRLIADRNQELTTALPAPASVFVLGDSIRLTQAIENLLHNASKYTESKGKIALSVDADTQTVQIKIRDSGSGIDAELLPHVFELFTQAPRSLDRAQGGLGLALVHNLIELHGGTVSASSAGIGQGSEFVISLPRLHGQAAQTPSDESAQQPPEKAEPHRVLVVDDESDVASALATLLERDGHQARTAYRGDTALEVCKAFASDVALLDIGLPDMDGYELARRIRAGRGGRDILLVAVTGYRRDVPRLEAAGFDRHLIKPFELNTLRSLIAKLPARGDAPIPKPRSPPNTDPAS